MTTWEDIEEILKNSPPTDYDDWDDLSSFVDKFGNPMGDTTSGAKTVPPPPVMVDPGLQSCSRPGEMSPIPADGAGISFSVPPNTAGTPQSTSEEESPSLQRMNSKDNTVTLATPEACTPASDSGSSSFPLEGLQQRLICVWDATNTTAEIPSITENNASAADPAEVSEPAKKRQKVFFSKDQIKVLQDRFQTQKYLTQAEIRSLAMEIKLQYIQVMTWFQNARMRTRKRGVTIMNPEAKRKANKNKQLVNISPRIDPVQQMKPPASINQPPQNNSFYQAAPHTDPRIVSYYNWLAIATGIPADNNFPQFGSYFLPPNASTMMNSAPTLPASYPVTQM